MGFIPKYGGYKNLYSYQKAEIVYDATVYFCKKFMAKYDRTVSQMVQAARSGKQNIAEGSMASGLSKQTEIFLTNVALASLEELLLDYKDFLRTNNLPEWASDDARVLRIRELNTSVTKPTYSTFRQAIEHENPEISANAIICLIMITGYLLKKQIASLEVRLIEEGGIRERITKARKDHRKY